MDEELYRITSSDFALEEHERRKLHGHSSADYFRYVSKKLTGYLFGRLKADELRLYSTGFDPAAFTLVASIPPKDDFRVISTLDTSFAAVNALHRLPSIPPSEQGQRPFLYIDNGRSIIIWLFGRGEYFGFITIFKKEGFSSEERDFIEECAPQLVRFMAEEIFAFRMHLLLEPFPYDSHDDEFFSTVVHQVVLGFGADGSTVRIFEPGEEVLHVKGSSGHSSGVLIEPRRPGEFLSGKVFESSAADVTAILTHRPSLDRGGAHISDEERERFAKAGLTSLIVGKLTRQDTTGRVHNFGSLSYFFLRPHVFSRRDIDLFHGFCKRVSDALLISQNFAELREQAALLEAQSRRITYVEIANLLAHDLWHKSFNTWSAAEENQEFVSKAVEGGKIRSSEGIIDELSRHGRDVYDLAHELHSTSSNLRSLQLRPGEGAYKPELFSLLDVLNSVEKVLKPALARQRISLRKSVSETHRMYGPRLLFEQVFFNLVINSIDAAKGRRSTRPISIDVHSHVRAGKLIVRYWDEGPGIDPIYFPNEQDVFAIGKTSKPEGTGTGLPVARQIIGTHFGGQLTLAPQRRPPLFTIEVPVDTKGS